jgi:hypothetical protein
MATTYEKIATTTLGSASSTITFSSIAASWTDIRLILVGTVTTSTIVRLRFNSDTGANYSETFIYGDGSTAASYANTGQSYITAGGLNFNWQSGTPCFSTTDVFSYAGSTNKTVLHTESLDLNGSGNTASSVGLWRNTAAITTITLTAGASGTFATGTTATLYGILKA